MARRASRTHRSLTADRIDRIRASMPQSRDESPTIRELVEQRHRVRADRDRVRSWFVAAGEPDSPTAATVCCPRHGLRRSFEWVKADKRAQPDEAIDLDQIEQGHQCPPQAAS